DLDIESDRREEAIQYVYQRYGRLCAAQVANVITYRGRSALRDMAKALGFSTGQQDAWSRQLDRWGPLQKADLDDDIPPEVLDLTDKNIYRMLGRADSVGVFQVESRAQMATLPRLRPNKFYDLVVEVALIRPGPIQGGSVHPYIRRHAEESKGIDRTWEHDHP